MSERWQRELTKIHPARFEADQWERIVAGPRVELPEPRRSRVLAAAVAFAVFAAAAVFAWSAFTPLRSTTPGLGGSNVLSVPARGDVSAAFLANGQPVFVVHRPDGFVSVVDAISPRRVDGIGELVTWCTPIHSFVSWPSLSSFDWSGIYVGGVEAPPGLSSFAYQVLRRDHVGDASSIRIGAIGPPLAHHPIPVPPSEVRLCASDRATAHTVPTSRIWTSPVRAANASPAAWIAIEGALTVSKDGSVELCPGVVDQGCGNSAAVKGIDASGLRRELAAGSEYAGRHVWLARLTNGAVTELVITRIGS
jgi:hypothetical protein